ncbi:unnamed protein product [Soboliphyme baturini]|uniref:Uncharacterized protein n=1 Tax=Soboliphyme baturini TaxID=241478 RepID=A0A183IST7_9BILA|nr:unnamed protein product [Soboliphyme baturini]
MALTLSKIIPAPSLPGLPKAAQAVGGYEVSDQNLLTALCQSERSSITTAEEDRRNDVEDTSQQQSRYPF